MSSFVAAALKKAPASGEHSRYSRAIEAVTLGPRAASTFAAASAPAKSPRSTSATTR